jgi:hypothetical protein
VATREGFCQAGGAEQARSRVKEVQLNSVGLFLCHVADDRQFEFLTLVGADHAENDHNEEPNPNQEVDRNKQESDHRNERKDRQCNKHDEPRRGNEETLERVKSNEAILVEWFYHQEDDRGNDGDVGKESGHIVGEAADWGRGGGDRTSGHRFTAGRAELNTVGNLCSTFAAKSHNHPREYAPNPMSCARMSCRKRLRGSRGKVSKYPSERKPNLSSSMRAFHGTGSGIACGALPLHRQRRFAVSRSPLRMPNRCTAAIEYSEQVG